MGIPRGVARLFLFFSPHKEVTSDDSQILLVKVFKHTCTSAVVMCRHRPPQTVCLSARTPPNLARDRDSHSLHMSPSAASQLKGPQIVLAASRPASFGSVPGPTVSVTLVCPLCLWIPAAPIGPHCPQQNGFWQQAAGQTGGKVKWRLRLSFRQINKAWL